MSAELETVEYDIEARKSLLKKVTGEMGQVWQVSSKLCFHLFLIEFSFHKQLYTSLSLVQLCTHTYSFGFKQEQILFVIIVFFFVFVFKKNVF